MELHQYLNIYLIIWTFLKNEFFNTSVHAGIVHNNWKLITGDAGHSGFYKNRTEIPGRT